METWAHISSQTQPEMDLFPSHRLPVIFMRLLETGKHPQRVQRSEMNASMKNMGLRNSACTGCSGSRPERFSDTSGWNTDSGSGGIGSGSECTNREEAGNHNLDWERTFPCCSLSWCDSGVIPGELGAEVRPSKLRQPQWCRSTIIKIK